MIETRNVPEIVDLGNDEIARLLREVNFGHLGLSRDDRPYVVPVHFAYDEPHVFFFTTEGLKTDIIDVNSTVCLQVEDVKDRENWQSVILTGKAERLISDPDKGNALELIKAVNPKLSPAWSVRWLDGWVRSNVEVIYRITPEFITGRRTLAKVIN
ncbi:MAG: pyridoxamine 5'-phosphate oxidase family protein [Pyrinomonadaceae bacterium]